MELDMDLKKTEQELHDFVEDVTINVMKSDFSKLAEIARILVEAKQKDRMVFTLGNGGGAATAAHLTNDLTKGCRVLDREGFRALCLNDPVAIVTCFANDFCYDETYALMLKTLGRPGDVMIVLSGSCTSVNSINALKQAREMGITAVGIGGRDGGTMIEHCDVYILAPEYCMEKIEDMYMMYCHSLVCIVHDILEKEFGVETLRFPDPKMRYRRVGILADKATRGMDAFVARVRAAGIECEVLGELPREYCGADSILVVDEAGAPIWEGVERPYIAGIAAAAGSREILPEKRQALVDKGADIIIPDLSNPEYLYQFLFGVMELERW